ncbi:MAG: CRISPR-associated helicase Cas3' [Deltaproteobacteria bacterium]|nr:CRISPR-associated helicase Cas3' [Deltaproteobacteria bacterium]
MNYYAHYRKQDNVFQTNEQHLEESAIFAKNLCEKIGMPSWGELLGLLHDIAKYSQKFQNYFLSSIGLIRSYDENYLDPRTHRGKIDHATAGGQFIWNHFSNNAIQKLISQIVVLCLVSHHGGLIDCLKTDGTDLFSQRIAKDYQTTFYNEITGKIDKNILSRIHSILRSGNLEKELLAQIDIISSLKMSPLMRRFHIGLLTRFLFSCLVDADRTNTADFDDPHRKKWLQGCPEWATLIREFDAYIGQFDTKDTPINHVRSSISTACLQAATCEKGAYLLTLPTGSGKTLASLRFALHHANASKRKKDRILYVVPYTTIIDQNARTVRSIFKQLKNPHIILEHHSNLAPAMDNEQNQILSENWDAPIVFTTMVQFLDALFSEGTRGVRRMHQLANSVIIFDEIQTLPIKTVHLFNNAMNFLVNSAGTTAVYCTATQPLLHDVDASKGALILSKPDSIVALDSDQKKAFQRIAIIDQCKAGGWTNDEIAEQASLNLTEFGSVLVIVNTKAVAKAIYKRCEEKKYTPNIFHLSTSMCPAHRKSVFKRINKLLNDKKAPIVCISTQLIEAGVDIDFGCVMRSLAGLDSIAQAAGRCNRHGDRPSAKMVIFNSSQENLSKLREIKIAQEDTLRVLDGLKDKTAGREVVIDEQSMNLFYRYYFYDRKDEMAYPIGTEDIGRNDTLLNLLAENSISIEEYRRAYKISPPHSLHQSFKTAGKLFAAIDAPTQSVVVPYDRAGNYIIGKLNEVKDGGTLNRLLKRAQRYSVNMFPYLFEKLSKNRYIHKTKDDIFYLSPECYSMKFGVSDEPVEDMPFLHC